MIETDTRSILQLCQTNIDIHNLCLDKLFWKRKLTKDYPDALPYLDSKTSFHRSYVYLTVGTPDQAAVDGHLGLLKYFFTRNKLPSSAAMIMAIKNNNLNIVKWYPNTLPELSIQKVSYLAGNGYLDMLKYLYSKYMILNYNYKNKWSILESALDEKQFDVADWIDEIWGIENITDSDIVWETAKSEDYVLYEYLSEIFDLTLDQIIESSISYGYQDSLTKLQKVKKKWTNLGLI